MFASKLVYNTNNYIAVSGHAQTGILVNNKKPYYFGLEEWNNQQLLKDKKVAYIDSYRRFVRIGIADKIVLICYNPNDGCIYHCGNLINVRQLENSEIPVLRSYLNTNYWLQLIERSFHAIGDLRPIHTHTEYMRCWNSHNIIAGAGGSFILNVMYEKADFFERKNWKNLSKIIPKINSKWRKLNQRYTVPKEWEELFN
jgi:hypothetical protein